VSTSTIALIAVPFFTGAIGYVTNWTGVLMLFYPVRFRGWRAGWLRSVAHVLPYRLQQIPGIMIGGVGWQGIVPSRAAKMGSLAVDVGIAKLGTPREFFDQLEPARIAEHIANSVKDEIRPIVDEVMEREQPRLWRDLPRAIRELVYNRVDSQLPSIVQDLTDRIAEHIEQLVDVKLMVIRRFEADPELANRVFLDMGQRELKFIQNFGFFFGFLLGIPVAVVTHFLTAWWILPILGVFVGYVTNWMALWMIYEPAEPWQLGPWRIHGLFVRRQPEVADVYARIVAQEIITVANFGGELLHGPQSDRTRALIESSMRPVIDTAVGPVRPALRVALGEESYESIRHALAVAPVETMMAPLSDPEFSASQSATMRKLIAERMREMAPKDFAEMLHTATREDEWLLLLHGAVLGFAGGVLHGVVFGMIL
jgi:uncharacterized membrane protein YheB (UPF0754 family)